jgi:hypothetical protein
MINVNVIQCNHLNPKETWPYVAGRCNNDSLPGRAYCEEHQNEEANFEDVPSREDTEKLAEELLKEFISDLDVQWKEG